jgi:hypothetical protein
MTTGVLEGIYSRYSDAVYAGGSDKGTLHSYIPFYESLLAPHRMSARRVLEIGVHQGHSLRMWWDYFPYAEIIGIDLYRCFVKGCTVVEGDATDPETTRFIDDIDIVIDDGSHIHQQQVAAFNLLWPKVKPGGLYIIEDIGCLESMYETLVELDDSVVIYDFRSLKGRMDDVMVVYSKAERDGN